MAALALRVAVTVALVLAGCDLPDPEVVGQMEQPRSGTPPLVDLPPAPLLSPAGYRLILDFEVGGGQPYYDRYLSRPGWPGASSGVTVGGGYDCGYHAPAVIRHDWRALPEAPRLAATSGVTGAAAKARVAEVRDILVAWELAEAVFNEVTLTRFYQLAQRTFPGFDALHSNARAALVSLVFNRGSSMTGERRREMREIRDCVARKDYPGMAAANRASIRVWRGTGVERGMARRREAEARLMETP